MEVGSGAGKYSILDLIGQGAMGEVYRARQVSLGRDVALKILKPHDTYDTHAVERFLRESRLTARLSHPDLIRVFDVGSHEGRPYLVMELLEGSSLKDHARLFPAADIGWKLSILRDITRGLAYLHEQGIIHRDLKPANVMLSRQGRVKVCDFGLAYAEWESRLTAQGAVLGTLKYMAPESFNQENPSPASDLFALGILAYWLLLDKLPYTALETFELVYQIQHLVPAPPSSVDPSIPESVDAWIMRLLAKKAAERPTAGQALAAIEPLALPFERSPVSAPPAAPPSRGVGRGAPGKGVPPTRALPVPGTTTRDASGPPPPSTRLFRVARRYRYALGAVLGIGVFALGILAGNRSRHEAPEASAPPADVTEVSSPTAAPTPLPDSLRDILPGALGIPIELVRIPTGRFRMGAVDPGTGFWIEIQRPVHEVKVKEFYLGKYEVTEAQFEAVMSRGVKKPRRDFPMTQVTWPEATEFCERLSRHTGRRYRLPGEAEWEYACRAGSETVFFFGTEEKSMPEYGNVGDFISGLVKVGSLKPNAWGLFDMYGNVWEWVEDDFHMSYVGAPPDARPWIDPVKAGEKPEKLLRGGGMVNPMGQIRSSARMPAKLPTTPDWGFRVACDP